MVINMVVSTIVTILIFLFGIRYLGDNKKRTAAIFVINSMVTLALVYLHRNNNLVTNLRLVSLLTILWPIAVNDYKEHKIPNRLLLIESGFGIGTFVLEAIINPKHLKSDIMSGFIACTGIFLVSMLCILLFKNSIGMGDIKLFMVMGLLQGVNGLFSAIFFSLLISFFVACYLLIRRKKDRKDNMSFGPAILVGTTISVLLGGM